MNKLEARIIVEDTGNYDEEEIEDILEICEELEKHIGFEDRRRDSRFVVKFHDICYYSPDEKIVSDPTFWSLFDIFCDEQIEWIKEENETEGIDGDLMLTHYNCGHYPAFKVDIPEITKENIIDKAMEIYDEADYRGAEYVKSYIFIVEKLQAMEDNYMENWFEFLRCGEYIPEEEIKNMEEKYHKDMERRKAK